MYIVQRLIGINWQHLDNCVTLDRAYESLVWFFSFGGSRFRIIKPLFSDTLNDYNGYQILYECNGNLYNTIATNKIDWKQDGF
jgi:hypothetical protein